MTDIIGNRKIIAAFSGVDIECVRSVNFCAPFLCSLFAENSHSYSVKSENEFSLIHREIISADKAGKIWINDYCDKEEPVFIRKVEIVSSYINYYIKTPPNAKIYHPISNAALICDGEFCVCISLSGNARFIGEKIEISYGVSYISFIASKVNNLPSLVNSRISPEKIFENAKARRKDRLSDSLLRAVALQKECGGVLHDAANDDIFILEQESALKEFLAGGFYEKAKKVIEFIISAYRRNSFLPYSVNCKGEVLENAPHANSLLPSVAAICANEYLKKTNDSDFIAYNFKAIAKITMAQCDELICSHMPFCGKEKVFYGALPMIAIEYGSLLSDIAFIESGKALLSLSDSLGVSFSGKSRLLKYLQACENSLSDYEFNGETHINCRKRFMRAKKPDSLYCRCEYCSYFSVNEKEQFCFLDSHRRYACLSCFGKASPEGLATLTEIATEKKSRDDIINEIFK